MGLPIAPLDPHWWTRLVPLAALYAVRRPAGRSIAVLTRGPGEATVLFKIVLWLGLRVTHDPASRPAIVVEASTRLSRSYPPHAWNSRCTDIGKATVQRLFAAAFGYELGVDPRRHLGPMVEKSDANATHDGAVVDGPCEPAAGKVYGRLVDNVVGGEAEDLRTTIVRGRIACVIRKRRALASRFSNTNSSARIVSPGVFSPAETARILALAEAIGLDFGEMDILRDRTDGRIYVVDVNRSPFGPPNGIGWRDHFRAIRSIAGAFRAALAEAAAP